MKVPRYNMEAPNLRKLRSNLQDATSEPLTELLWRNAISTLNLPEDEDSWTLEQMISFATYICAQGGIAATLSNGFKIRCLTYKNLLER